MNILKKLICKINGHYPRPGVRDREIKNMGVQCIRCGIKWEVPTDTDREFVRYDYEARIQANAELQSATIQKINWIRR